LAKPLRRAARKETSSASPAKTAGAVAAPAAPETLVDACKIGVEAEIANRDLYDGNLLPAGAAYPDITLVMQRLRDASEENHLPAFERCVAKG
jgi:hypothetical protein